MLLTQILIYAIHPHTSDGGEFYLMVRDVKEQNNEGTFSAPNRFSDFLSSFYRRVKP